MTVRKRKKNSRMRASLTHGWGAKKKHRSAGHKGGRGRAGSGKRGDAKKPSFWAEGRPGKHGFISRSTFKQNAITLDQISNMIVHEKISKKGSVYEVNLTEMGYTKLLSSGSVKHPINITVAKATEKAVAKIEAAGGSVKTASAE